MTTRYWDGSTDGDLNTATNWTPAAVPSASDDIIFDARTTQAVDTGLDTFNTVDLGSLTVQSDYTGAIGSSTAPFEFECSAGRVYLAGTGTSYFQCDGGADVDASILKCVINGGTVYLSSQANDDSNAAVWTEIQILAGTVYLQGDSEASGGHAGDTGIAVTLLKITPVIACTVRIGDKCINELTDAAMDLIMDGGTLTCSSALDDVQLMDGILNYGSATIDMATADDDIGTLTISGGTFNWIPQSSTGTVLSATPTITNLNVIGGIFNATNTKQTASSDPTITTAWHYGGTIDLRNTFANFAVTTFYAEGGSLHYSPGQVLTLS